MTAQQAAAYNRVMKTLEDLSAAKFHAHEQQLVREAADALLFGDEDAERAYERVGEMLDDMVEADRLLPDTAGALLDDLRACGPQPVAA